MHSSAVWNITPYSTSKVCRRFGVTSRLHVWGRRLGQAWNNLGIGSKQSLILFLRNVGWLSIENTPLYPIIQKSSYPSLWEPQILMKCKVIFTVVLPQLVVAIPQDAAISAMRRSSECLCCFAADCLGNILKVVRHDIGVPSWVSNQQLVCPATYRPCILLWMKRK
jgi:hypothetical protein